MATFGGDSFLSKKPSPVPIQHLLDMFNLTNREAVIVGDSSADIEAGNNAEIFTIFASYGYGKKVDNYNYSIDSLADLKHILPL